MVTFFTSLERKKKSRVSFLFRKLLQSTEPEEKGLEYDKTMKED